MTDSVDRTYSYVTQRKTRSIKYDWLIKDFSFYGKEVLESSTFSSGLTEVQDEWTLQIDLNHLPNTNNVEVVLKLNSLADNSNFLARYEVSILHTISKQKQASFLKSTVPVKFSIDRKEVIYSLQRSTLINYLSNDTLLISCELKISTNGPVVNQPIMTNICENVDTAERHLKDDYADLLESGKSSDIIITVKTKSFKAIKGILAARSPVFSAMFNHDEVKENTENEVIIEDIDEDVFEELLYYMYTSEVKNIQEMPMGLLTAANKYQLDHLKTQCEKALLSSIDIETATEFFVFADKYKADNLKHGALMFIKSNLRDVLASKSFKELKEGNSSVLLEILQAVGGGD